MGRSGAAAAEQSGADRIRRGRGDENALPISANNLVRESLRWRAASRTRRVPATTTSPAANGDTQTDDSVIQRGPQKT